MLLDWFTELGPKEKVEVVLGIATTVATCAGIWIAVMGIRLASKSIQMSAFLHRKEIEPILAIAVPDVVSGDSPNYRRVVLTNRARGRAKIFRLKCSVEQTDFVILPFEFATPLITNKLTPDSSAIAANNMFPFKIGLHESRDFILKLGFSAPHDDLVKSLTFPVFFENEAGDALVTTLIYDARTARYEGVPNDITRSQFETMLRANK